MPAGEVANPPPAATNDNRVGQGLNANALTRVVGAAVINRTRNNNNQEHLLHLRDRLFHTLFVKAALAYARLFPRPVRRFIEFLILLKVKFETSHFLFFYNIKIQF